ncbi:MAG: hypothetical protein AB1716_26290 [Planctomycetota bacterium]
MSSRASYGRTVTLLVLGVLLLTVCLAVYLALGRWVYPSATPQGAEDMRALESQRLITLLAILLISALLILLFVMGAYLLINVGRLVARERVGGQPTEYIDAWGQYRLSDEQINAATQEDARDEPGRRRPPGPTGESPGPSPPEPPGPAGPPPHNSDAPPNPEP